VTRRGSYEILKKIINNILLYNKNVIINKKTFTFQRAKSQSVFFGNRISLNAALGKISFNIDVLK